jgi:hypothetical protein
MDDGGIAQLVARRDYSNNIYSLDAKQEAIGTACPGGEDRRI